MAEFLTDLTIRDIGFQKFMFTAPLIYRSDLLGCDITIPAGFISDGESSPRWLPIINSLFGDVASQAPGLHDFLYWIGIYGQKQSDLVLLEALRILPDIATWREEGIYYGLRLAGWYAWEQHRKAGHSDKDDFSGNLKLYPR